MKSQTMAVNNASDIILVRISARELAGDLGMDVADQARVSLAVSFIVKTMGLGLSGPGQVTLADCSKGSRIGLQAVCAGKNGQRQCWPDLAGPTRWMVDELLFEALPPDGWQITFVKWRE